MFTWYTIGWGMPPFGPDDIDIPPLMDSRGSDFPETEFCWENWLAACYWNIICWYCMERIWFSCSYLVMSSGFMKFCCMDIYGGPPNIGIPMCGNCCMFGGILPMPWLLLMFEF